MSFSTSNFEKESSEPKSTKSKQTEFTIDQRTKYGRISMKHEQVEYIVNKLYSYVNSIQRMRKIDFLKHYGRSSRIDEKNIYEDCVLQLTSQIASIKELIQKSTESEDDQYRAEEGYRRIKRLIEAIANAEAKYLELNENACSYLAMPLTRHQVTLDISFLDTIFSHYRLFSNNFDKFLYDKAFEISNQINAFDCDFEAIRSILCMFHLTFDEKEYSKSIRKIGRKINKFLVLQRRSSRNKYRKNNKVWRKAQRHLRRVEIELRKFYDQLKRKRELALHLSTSYQKGELGVTEWILNNLYNVGDNIEQSKDNAFFKEFNAFYTQSYSEYLSFQEDLKKKFRAIEKDTESEIINRYFNN